MFNIGIHVLRILKYDRQALAMRRMQCENNDSDPIVWTNQRFIRWARSIDLSEYADNLKGNKQSSISMNSINKKQFFIWYKFSTHR